MKKYVKPELFYEHFELSQHIAACAFDKHTDAGDPSACAFIGDETSDWAGFVVFIESNKACEWSTEDYCYYTGADGMNLFNS